MSLNEDTIETEPEVLYGTARFVRYVGEHDDVGMDHYGGRYAAYAVNPAVHFSDEEGRYRRAAYVIVEVAQIRGALSPITTFVMGAKRHVAPGAAGGAIFSAITRREHAISTVRDDDVAAALAGCDYDVDTSALTGGPPDPALALLSRVRQAVKTCCDEASLHENDSVRHAQVATALAIEQVAVETYRRLVAGAS